MNNYVCFCIYDLTQNEILGHTGVIKCLQVIHYEVFTPGQ